jgi:hypothetical protein
MSRRPFCNATSRHARQEHTVQIVNKTPHVLNIIIGDGSVRAIAPTLPTPRVSTKRVALDPVDGIPVDGVEFGEVVDLPAPVDGVVLIVSGLTASAVKGRTDLLVVGEAVRDADGVTVGCKGLSRPG